MTSATRQRRKRSTKSSTLHSEHLEARQLFAAVADGVSKEIAEHASEQAAHSLTEEVASVFDSKGTAATGAKGQSVVSGVKIDHSFLAAKQDHLPDTGTFEQMRDLRELQRLIEDFEQGFQMPEMHDGLPGGWNPSVEGLQQGVMGEGTSVEDVIFGRQGPRWDGVGMDVESFGEGTQGNSRYPSAEPGPSGSAAPDITPNADRNAEHRPTFFDRVITRKFSTDNGCILQHIYYTEDNRHETEHVYVEINDGQVTRVYDPVSGGYWADIWRNSTGSLDEITDALDYYLLGKARNDGDFVRHMDDLDDQPNPEGDDAGGPAGGQREFLSWLAGRPTKAGNAALNQPITKWDVLGQPDPEGTRHCSSTPSRFARMHFDIDPAPFKSTAQAEGSTWCPPVGPDDPDSPRGPDGPVGPGGPSPVK